MQLIKFAYGNTHEEVKQPEKENTNTHRWCMFVSLNGSPEETNKYIKSVTYHLHPTFRQPKIKVSEAPFLLSRLGWGWFEVEMDIEFQPSTKLGTKRLKHMLEFDGNGKTQSILLEVQSNDKDQALAVQLAAQLDKMNRVSSKKR